MLQFKHSFCLCEEAEQLGITAGSEHTQYLSLCVSSSSAPLTPEPLTLVKADCLDKIHLMTQFDKKTNRQTPVKALHMLT